MAGPTPVSALIHAATMVTSGIFLLSRLNGLVTMAWQAMAVIAVVGALTAFFAATIAFVQTDIKKVLAYSTVSQLGYMFLAIGTGSFVGAIFHLMTHAFFKALLFLGSGSVIHAMGGEQDIRKMGGLKAYMPVTRLTFLIGCIAIAGVPFIGAGFFSKDLILWSALSNVHIGQVAGLFNGLPSVEMLTSQVAPAIAQGAALEVMLPWKIIYGLVAVLGFATAGMTAFYMFRLYFLTFEGECRADDHTKEHLHESPIAITIPLSVLAILSVAGGWTGWPHFIAHLVPESAEHAMLAFEHWLAPVFEMSMKYRVVNHFGAEYAKWEIASAVAGSALALLGIFAAYSVYVKRPSIARNFADKYRKLHQVLMDKYKVDEFYDATFVRGTINAGKASYEVDQKVIDGLGVDGAGFMTKSLGEALRYLQGGDVQKYAVYLVVAMTMAFMALALV
ncbi:MAG: proton-conducting transporter membrane subunit [bacterium]